VRACEICCGPTVAPFVHCFACRTLAELLHGPLTPVLPASLCPVPGPLYRVLMGYKESPVDEARRRFARRVGELFDAFLSGHRVCVEEALGGSVGLVLPVPSSSRPSGSPLSHVDGLGPRTAAVLGQGACWLPPVLERGRGEIGHMRPNPAAFVVARHFQQAVRGSRVVLLDDTYVSGSRAQSAAMALRRAQARAVVIAPLGRVVRPERYRAHTALVDQTAPGDGHRLKCVRSQTRVARG
jgi:hypothetical protein